MTNVVVLYVMNSKTNDSVMPDTTAGIVNIVAEIDSGKAAKAGKVTLAKDKSGVDESR